MTQDPGPLGPWERGEDTLFLFPLPPLEQHGVTKAACGRHFTHLGPSSAIHGWVADLPLRRLFSHSRVGGSAQFPLHRVLVRITIPVNVY